MRTINSDFGMGQFWLEFTANLHIPSLLVGYSPKICLSYKESSVRIIKNLGKSYFWHRLAAVVCRLHMPVKFVMINDDNNKWTGESFFSIFRLFLPNGKWGLKQKKKKKRSGLSIHRRQQRRRPVTMNDVDLSEFKTTFWESVKNVHKWRVSHNLRNYR